MDKSFIIQQLAYHTMICDGLRQQLEHLHSPAKEFSQAEQAIKESRQAVQTVSYEEMAASVKKFAVSRSKEEARSILFKIAGVSLIRDVKPEFYNKIYEATNHG